MACAGNMEGKNGPLCSGGRAVWEPPSGHWEPVNCPLGDSGRLGGPGCPRTCGGALPPGGLDGLRQGGDPDGKGKLPFGHVHRQRPTASKVGRLPGDVGTPAWPSHQRSPPHRQPRTSRTGSGTAHDASAPLVPSEAAQGSSSRSAASGRELRPVNRASTPAARAGIPNAVPADGIASASLPLPDRRQYGNACGRSARAMPAKGRSSKA